MAISPLHWYVTFVVLFSLYFNDLLRILAVKWLRRIPSGFVPRKFAAMDGEVNLSFMLSSYNKN